MRCPRLSELPPPPPGKTGWPWTEETPLAPAMPEASSARISIVTPSFNSLHYLEETMRSVLLQGYPDLEYIIIDGGSTDGAVDLIRKYEQWIAYWVSEKDRGYADAVNKGFARATGDIRAWLPASDLYLPSALQAAGRYLGRHQVDFIYGCLVEIGERNNRLGISPVISKNLRHLGLYGRGNPGQPATFWRREIHERAGQLNSNLRNASDSEWFLRLSLMGRSRWVPEQLCCIRQHAGQLSGNMKNMLEEWFSAWDAVVRAHRIPRLQILIGALCFVPLMRYRAGGLKSLFRIPKKQVLLRTLFRRKTE